MRLCSPRHEKDAFRDSGEAIADAFRQCRILRPNDPTPIANRESGGTRIDRYALPPKPVSAHSQFKQLAHAVHSGFGAHGAQGAVDGLIATALRIRAAKG
jgi:hypothetical protein